MRRLLPALLALVACSARPAGAPSSIALAYDNVDFGPVAVGASVTREIPFTVSGPDPAQVEGATAGFRAGVDSGVLRITFAPDAPGSFSADIVVRAGSARAAVHVLASAYAGTDPVEHFVLDPSSLDFGRQPVGTSTCRDVTIRNDGDLPIVFVAVEPDAGLASEGVLDVRAGALLDGAPLAPLASTTVSICFKPGTRGKAYGGGLHFRVVGGAPESLTIAGTGGGPVLATDPADVDLGVASLGAPNVRTIALENTGDTGSLVIRSVQLVGGDPVFQLAFPDGEPVGRDVGAASFPIQVVMNDVFGEHSGTIVVEAADGQTVRIQVHGVAVDGAPCDLETPERLRFGFVDYESTHVRPLSIHNTSATNVCYVWGFGIDPMGAEGFSLQDAPVGLTAIEPGEALTVHVAFAATTSSIDTVESSVRFHRVAPDRQAAVVTVPLSAFTTQLVLPVSPDPIDFGTVQVGVPVHMSVTLTNNGTHPIKLGGNQPPPNPRGDVAISTDSAFGFSVYKVPTVWPWTLGSGDTMTFTVVFQPQAAGHYEGYLEIWLLNVPEPIVVPIVADAVGPACAGYRCADFIAQCPVALTAQVGSGLDLVGHVFDAHEPSAITCQWSLVSAPAGSQAAMAAGNGCDAPLNPDVPGDYTVKLSAVDDAGRTSTCQTKVKASEHAPGLQIQTTWDWPEDLDLHLFEALDLSDAHAWLDSSACSYNNQHPAWDSPGPEDDPVFVADDQTGLGPEIIEVPAPVAGQNYAIGVHWFGNSDGVGTVTATTRISCSNTQVAEVQTVLRNYAAAFVGTVDWSVDGTCHFTPGGGSITLVP